MSINALTSKDTDKGWANLYVNTLTTYNGLTVDGPTKLGPVEKKTCVFNSVFPADHDPIDVVIRNVGGIVCAEVEAFTHNHGTAVTYNYETASHDWAGPAETLDLPVWVNESTDRTVGVMRVMAHPSNQIFFAKDINGDGSLLPFPSGNSGVSDGQSVVWNAA
jgi:hypothetical protein